MWKVLLFLGLLSSSLCITSPSIYASSCSSQSTASNRTCVQGTNTTQYLLSIKKGGANVLSSDDYDASFFDCQQFTYDCGYVQNSQSTIQIADGIQLNMTVSHLNSLLPLNSSTANLIAPYLNLNADEAKCGMKIFPLILTPDQSILFFTSYMDALTTQVKTKYAAEKKNGTKTWAALNINIKTAILMVIKEDSTCLTNQFWADFTTNTFSDMSDYLKNQFDLTNELYYLRSSYLIDSVTKKCNKMQSVNFLVDQSGSIQAANFVFAKQFLYDYINTTNDDPAMDSIHFYDSTFEPWLGYGNTKAQLLAGINSKPYRGLGTYTGSAINQTIAKILAANFSSGVNKVLIILTDGFSYDNVLDASNYARSKGITVISVGIGPNTNYVQLLEMAETPSNIIQVTSYNDLGRMIQFISNYFCKQLINLSINQTIIDNEVRVPDSPAYFRIQKSNTDQTYLLLITYLSDPQLSNISLFSSQYDPFPDRFTDFSITQSYRPQITQRIYFVQPCQNASIRLKKDYYIKQPITNSYVSVGGSNVKFNISLKPCATRTCVAEKTSLASYGTQKDPSPTADKDYNIYAIIAASIAGLVCLAASGILALRKVFGGQEQQLVGEIANQDQLHPQITQEDINDHFDDDQFSQKKPKYSDKSNHQNQSHKSHSSNKSNKSNKQNGSHKKSPPKKSQAAKKHQSPSKKHESPQKKHEQMNKKQQKVPKRQQDHKKQVQKRSQSPKSHGSPKSDGSAKSHGSPKHRSPKSPKSHKKH